MSPLPAAVVADYWVGAGGPVNRRVEWVAIAMGESSLDPNAVSSAGAIGLWQIMPFNAPPYGFSPGQLYDPHVNAIVAVRMSGGGTNCAAWDSAYRDINASGRYSFLGWPEAGSADFHNIAIAAAELGGAQVNPVGGGGGGGQQPGMADTLTSTAAAMEQIATGLVPHQVNLARVAVSQLQVMYRR